MNNNDLIINFKFTEGVGMTKARADNIIADAEKLVSLLERMNLIKVSSIIVAEGISKKRI